MINNVQLAGRLVKDPELRYTPTGVAVTNVTLAIRRDYKNKQGEVESDFVQIQIWRRDAENTANMMKKGDILGVTAKIQTRRYEGPDGKMVYSTDVVASSVQFIHRQNRQGGGNDGNSNYQNNNQQGNYQNNGQQGNYQQGTQAQQYNQNNNQQAYQNNNQQGQQGNQNYTRQNNQGADYDPFAIDSKAIEVSDDDLPF